MTIDSLNSHDFPVRRLAAGLVLALIAAVHPVGAQEATPMTAAEFEAYVDGRTMTFGIGSEPYGIEIYRSNRRVTWAFIGGDCEDGYWYPKGQDICFVYDFSPDPQCWQFFRDASGLRAVFTNDPGTTVLYEAQDADTPLICPGPDVGV